MVAQARKPIVIGTTGWDEQREQIKALSESADIGVIHSSNFSIGMNLFFRIVENAANLFNQFPDYDPYIQEIHHRMKIDSPSGTALMLGEILLEGIQRKDKLLVNKADGKIPENEIHVSSTRTGNVPGTHLVAFDSVSDSIELRHTVRNRNGFAIGAIFAAEWLMSKKGFFSMKDMFTEIFT
jgi:4-hydroxy-tetrahydrodipicolinate reductase